MPVAKQNHLELMMADLRSAQAVQFIRKLRGGSQSILALGNDGSFYVIKFPDNPQGPNLPFNEAVGSELFRRLGLATPEWRLIDVSDDFLDRNPGCWFESKEGRQRPRAGLCFGSQFVGLNDPELFEILPTPYFSRIRNRKDFWIAWAADVLCEHSDNRQALFVGSSRGCLDAIFIDHGHMFKGPDGKASPLLRASQYLNPEMYLPFDHQGVREVVNALESVDLGAVSRMAARLPTAWRTPSAVAALELFVQRMTRNPNLSSTVCSLIGLTEQMRRCNERPQAAPTFRLDRETLRAQVSELAFAG